MVAQRPVDSIIQFLTSFPTPEEVLAFRISAENQERLTVLLYENSARQLSEEEKQELEYFKIVEHMMRSARFNAKRLLKK